jgi:hypothetical protein
MTDDIVTRLRVATVADTAERLYQLMTDAADEIERLRTYIKQMPKGECTYCDLEYQKPTWLFPPHTASPRCQSGGHSHCTCDTCF